MRLQTIPTHQLNDDDENCVVDLLDTTFHENERQFSFFNSEELEKSWGKFKIFWNDKGKKIFIEGLFEIIFCYFAILVTYNWTGNHFGSYVVPPKVAFENAQYAIYLEKFLGLFVEESIQKIFLSWTIFMKFWDFFYGFFHTTTTVLLLCTLFLVNRTQFQHARTTIIVMNSISLFCVAIFPMMPPRLLNNCGKLGACDHSYSFVDSMAVIGGFWSWDNLEEFGTNQYAATPSMHIGYAIWFSTSIAPLVQKSWGRMMLIAYPILTFFCIVVTANHYWFDGIAGALTWFIARKITVYVLQFLDEKAASSTCNHEGSENQPINIVFVNIFLIFLRQESYKNKNEIIHV